MCDFRGPPKQIYDIYNKQTFDMPYLGELQNTDKINTTNLKASGFYYMVGTGCYYSYWDGSRFWEDCTWVINWKDRPKPIEHYWYAKYQFLGQEEHSWLSPRILSSWEDYKYPVACSG